MFRVLDLRKVPDTDPQEYELWLKDLENTKPGYIGKTHHGSESELRTILTNGGMSEPDIDKLFKQACIKATAFE
jgi:hypothetical protein